jgi:uncharacterized small protein (DUF1192 family)
MGAVTHQQTQASAPGVQYLNQLVTAVPGLNTRIAALERRAVFDPAAAQGIANRVDALAQRAVFDPAAVQVIADRVDALEHRAIFDPAAAQGLDARIAALEQNIAQLETAAIKLALTSLPRTAFEGTDADWPNHKQPFLANLIPCISEIETGSDCGVNKSVLGLLRAIKNFDLSATLETTLTREEANAMFRTLQRARDG